MHVSDELANELKSRGIECVDTDYKMASRLKFYGVTNCNTHMLTEKNLKYQNKAKLTIHYKNRAVNKAIDTKIKTNRIY